jgi:hypothetical protein
MTRPLGRLDEKAIPKVCPKCGRETREPHGEKLVEHLRADHADSIADAVPLHDPDQAREIAYVSPVAGTANTWHVVWLDWPYEVARLNRAFYAIRWKGRA